MANRPSEKWEDGKLVERAIETNRWRVLPDGTEVGEKESVESQETRPYKEPEQKFDVKGKAVRSSTTENKAVKATKTTAKKSS